MRCRPNTTLKRQIGGVEGLGQDWGCLLTTDPHTTYSCTFSISDQHENTSRYSSAGSRLGRRTACAHHVCTVCSAGCPYWKQERKQGPTTPRPQSSGTAVHKNGSQSDRPLQQMTAQPICGVGLLGTWYLKRSSLALVHCPNPASAAELYVLRSTGDDSFPSPSCTQPLFAVWFLTSGACAWRADG